MNWVALIASSRSLVTPILPASQPTDEALRRAVSTAYYAMFHALATSNADCIIGTSNDPLSRHPWDLAYRGLEHGIARTQLREGRHLFSPDTKWFGDTFGRLQEVRQRADYDHGEAFTPNLANTWIDRAEEAIRGFMQASIAERRAVAVQSLFRRRRN